MPLCGFPISFQKKFVEKVLFAMVKKTMDQHVVSNLASIAVMSISFDL
jgi:hypothetical protein